MGQRMRFVGVPFFCACGIFRDFLMQHSHKKLQIKNAKKSYLNE